jgi:hypothetical protein
MTALLSDSFETFSPTEADTQLARESSRKLAARKLGGELASAFRSWMTTRPRQWLCLRLRCGSCSMS